MKINHEEKTVSLERKETIATTYANLQIQSRTGTLVMDTIVLNQLIADRNVKPVPCTFFGYNIKDDTITDTYINIYSTGLASGASNVFFSVPDVLWKEIKKLIGKKKAVLVPIYKAKDGPIRSYSDIEKVIGYNVELA